MKMRLFVHLLLLHLSLFLDLANGQTTRSCNICGEGNSIGNDLGILSFEYPAGESRTFNCAQLQDLIQSANLFADDNNFCPFIAPIAASPCECLDSSGQPISSGGGEDSICNICGDGLTIGNDNGILNFDWQGDPRTLNCLQLQELVSSTSTFSDADFCPFINPIAQDPCDCTSTSTSTGSTCNICGDGNIIVDALAELTFEFPPGQERQLTCQQLQDLINTAGLFPDPTFCPFIFEIAVPTCQCATSEGVPVNPDDVIPAATATPTRVPTAIPSLAPVTEPPTATNFCNICGRGNTIGNDLGVIAFDYQPPPLIPPTPAPTFENETTLENITMSNDNNATNGPVILPEVQSLQFNCAQLQSIVNQQFVPNDPDFCDFVYGIAVLPCVCTSPEGIALTPAPTTNEPTDNPTDPPTLSPTSPPSPPVAGLPTVFPTISPKPTLPPTTTPPPPTPRPTFPPRTPFPTPQPTTADDGVPAVPPPTSSARSRLSAVPPLFFLLLLLLLVSC